MDYAHDEWITCNWKEVQMIGCHVSDKIDSMGSHDQLAVADWLKSCEIVRPCSQRRVQMSPHAVNKIILVCDFGGKGELRVNTPNGVYILNSIEYTGYIM